MRRREAWSSAAAAVTNAASGSLLPSPRPLTPPSHLPYRDYQSFFPPSVPHLSTYFPSRSSLLTVHRQFSFPSSLPFSTVLVPSILPLPLFPLPYSPLRLTTHTHTCNSSCLSLLLPSLPLPLLFLPLFLLFSLFLRNSFNSILIITSSQPLQTPLTPRSISSPLLPSFPPQFPQSLLILPSFFLILTKHIFNTTKNFRHQLITFGAH